jgi:HlyD family secretion protein
MAMAVRSYAAFTLAMALLVGGSRFYGFDFYGFDVLPTASARAESRSSIKEELHKIIEGLHGSDLPEGIVRTNGRVEATELDVAAKYPGRLATVTVNEGDEVTAGQVIARISSPEYEAQLRGARSQVLKAKHGVAEAEALIAERQNAKLYFDQDVARGQPLVEHGNLTKQVFDQRVTKAEVAKAQLHAAEQQREAAQYGLASTQAEVERIDAILVDLTLLAPRTGRVQYLVHRGGEVVNAGTRILTILDLNDVYMTIYLPAAQAGKLALGDEARVVLDPFPQYVVPATISFVATDAQFTPKTVETAEEREKLIFRIKLQIDPKVLGKYHKEVKTGVRGLGYVRTDSGIPWPENLAVNLP